jgi:hypothetical protein
MAFDALRSSLRRPAATPEPTMINASSALSGAPAATFGSASDQYAPVFADPVAGGGTDAQAFTCPGCGRTLTRGSRRCDGCGTRLILDVPLRRAATLSGAGALGGILVTVLLVNVFAPPAAPATAAGDGTATGQGVVAPVVIDIPTGAMAAIRGTTAINGRLAAEASPLSKALAAKPFDTTEVVAVLRRMAIDTRAGAGMLRAMAVWPEASGQQAALQAFYEDLGRRIDNGLNASVNSTGAYKKAAKGILSALKDVPGLDADARALAGLGGLELPAVTIPDQLR